MATSVLYMSMSLDGFITGPDEGPDNGLGDGGERLHEWVFDDGEMVTTGVNGQVVAEFMASGATVAGRRTFEWAGGWGGDHHDGVPIFIYSRREPGIDISGWPLVTYLDDIDETMSRAREAAGDKEVMVHGDTVTRLALSAGVLDELVIHLVPILLGGGRRLFDGTGPADLEHVRTLEGERGVTHLRYRVRR